jgi:hypothetical protein
MLNQLDSNREYQVDRSIFWITKSNGIRLYIFIINNIDRN